MIKSNKAQLAFFVLIGVVIILAFSVVLYIGNRETDVNSELIKLNELSFANAEVKLYMQECIENAAVDAATAFGYQQGHYTLPNDSLHLQANDVAYYYSQGRNQIPSNEFLEENFGKLMNAQVMRHCSFAELREQGYTIAQNTISTKATILEKKVVFELMYPIEIEKDLKTRVEKFSYELPYRIGHIINSSRILIDAVEDEPYALDLTLLLYQDLDISVFNYDPCNQIYIIIDNKSRMPQSEEGYVFAFAVNFEEEYCDYTVGSIPEETFDLFDEFD